MRYLKLYESYSKDVHQELFQMKLDYNQRLQQKLNTISNDIKECMFDLTDDYEYKYKVIDLTEHYDEPVEGTPIEYSFVFDFNINRDRWEDFSEKLKSVVDLVIDKLELKLGRGDVAALMGGIRHNLGSPLNLRRNTIEHWIEHYSNLIKILRESYTKLEITICFDL